MASTPPIKPNTTYNTPTDYGIAGLTWVGATVVFFCGTKGYFADERAAAGTSVVVGGVFAAGVLEYLKKPEQNADSAAKTQKVATSTLSSTPPEERQETSSSRAQSETESNSPRTSPQERPLAARSGVAFQVPLDGDSVSSRATHPALGRALPGSPAVSPIKAGSRRVSYDSGDTSDSESDADHPNESGAQTPSKRVVLIGDDADDSYL